MPLPAKNTAWPPPALDQIRKDMDVWSSLYSNDMAALSTAYGTKANGMSRPDRQGLIQRVIRFFWDNHQTDLTREPERKIHVPLAADIAQASADLLFSEPPTAVPANKDESNATTDERIRLITGPAFQQVIVSAAEVSAALGGVYFRATWDKDVADHVFISKIDADKAYPEFRHGKLIAVTFWQVVQSANNTVWRHLERHELNSFGVGQIVHGLYQGTLTNLGAPMAFADHPATAWLADLGAELVNGNTISTATPGLAVVYAPNIAPSRTWRNDPVGCNLGRSDYEGVEPLMDAFDEAFSSLMRDVRTGKSMLIVPQMMLNNNGPGQGASFTHDEVFTPVNAAPSAADQQKLAVEQIQFTIRVAEHEQTMMLIWNRIINSAGYSAGTFGEGKETMITATEVTSKERRSFMTRDRKLRALQPALEEIISKALAMDVALMKSGAAAIRVRVNFADGVQDDPEKLARTAQLLAVSLSASVETRVRLMHRDWEESAIKDEVRRILEENNLPILDDPDSVGQNGEGVPTVPARG